MKIKIIYTILLIICSAGLNSQVHTVNGPYVGTWEYQNGNNIFRLIIWEDSEPNPYDNKYYLKGHYEMIQISNNVETLIYTSNPAEIPEGQKYDWAFSGTINPDGSLSGLLREIHSGSSGLKASFKIIEITPTPCNGCALKIMFEYIRGERMRLKSSDDTSPSTMVIPNNIQLVKQQ